ncbi:hypothetical protein LguiB_033080 [Lonicera macranthoides]
MKDCVAVAIYGQLGTLAWCKCNDESWTPIGRAPILLHIPRIRFGEKPISILLKLEEQPLDKLIQLSHTISSIVKEVEQLDPQ